MKKQTKQVMLLNKLLSEDVGEVREALTALCGFAIAKKEWAVLTVNKAIIMLEYIAKEYYTAETIANKEMNNFFILKNAQYENLLFSYSNIGNEYAEPIKNTIYNAESWLKQFKDLVEYPNVMLSDFALTQEIILACSDKTEEIKKCLHNSTDKELAVRLFELFRGQMEVQAMYDGVNKEVHVCRRCGCRKFLHNKHSLICEVCGKQISNKPIYYWLEGLAGAGLVSWGVSMLSHSDEKIGGYIVLVMGIVSVVPIISIFIRKLQRLSKKTEYIEKNSKFNLSEEKLFEVIRAKLSQYNND